MLGALGHVYAASGHSVEALKMVDQLKERSKQSHVSSFEFVLVHVALGQKDQAFAWLEKAFEERNSWLPFLKVEPMLDGLRSDPRFADLVRRIGLPP